LRNGVLEVNKTIVVNVLGGPGVGKSTLASELFVHMKRRDTTCELIREYVKQWAWDGISVGPFDQLYILGKQAKYESRLYGKVDYVITESPFLLSAVYENFYTGKDIVLPTVLRFMRHALENGILHKNFVLQRQFEYERGGRYEDERTARQVDKAIESFLVDHDFPYHKVWDLEDVLLELER
jgi:nicotinamide riboside kinase